MKSFSFVLFLFLSIGTVTAQRPRLIVTTDIGQDPDDEQSLVRLLHYANEFDLEGLIANADANYEKEAAVLKTKIIHKMIDGYASIEKNLILHAAEYPKSTYLHTIVKEGTFGNGHNVPVEDFIGENHDTEGSDWIIEVVDKKDPRPVNVAVWGGACDLAQALWKIQHSRGKNEVERFVQKLRVFFIGRQDSSNQWIIDTFPHIWLILAMDRNGNKWESGYRGMFWGGDMRNTSKEWLHENIISQNSLASHYPDHAYTGGAGKNPHMAMKEGDSPSFLYFLENGLNQPDHPEWGSWGGRYKPERDQFYRDANDDYFDAQTREIINSPRATVFRWRIDFQNDFAARVQWGTKKHSEANHHPVITVNGENSKNPLKIKVKSGDGILLDASKSSDFDKDNLSFEWLVYKEAGTYMGTLKIKKPDKPKISFKSPKDAKGTNIHLICRVTDNGIPALTSYKRVIIQME